MNQKYIDICIEEAELSYQQGDVPIGALIVDKQDNIIARAHNTRQKDSNILGHAEINAVIMASQTLKRWNLSDCDLYVTLKPCSMCLEVLKQSRIANIYYLLDKFDYKKEYDRTKMLKISDKEQEKNEQMYQKMLNSFFKQKR